MPPHPEVAAALRRLRDHGLRLFTLTDNKLEISGRQLEEAGVIGLFERRSAWMRPCAGTRRRPRPTSHVWDTLGAVAASWQAALILHAGKRCQAEAPDDVELELLEL